MTFITKCTLLGHRWLYKSYINSMKSDGTKYIFTATRMCKRCEKKQYKFDSWVDEKEVLKADRDGIYV